MSDHYPSSGKVELRTNLADYPSTRALKQGEIETGEAVFRFEGPAGASKGFKAMVRDGAFDAGELAIVTFLQAKAYGKPLTLLPATVVGRLQHHCLVRNRKRGPLAPKDLEGRTVAVRSYTQTTGVWVRGILQHQFGVDIDRVTWLCSEDAHLAEYSDPPNVKRAPAGGKSIAELLLDGDVDAAIFGNDMPDSPDIGPVIADPATAAADWYKQNLSAMINHVFVVNSELAKARPEIIRAIYDALLKSKSKGPAAEEPDMLPFGYSVMRGGLERIITYAFEQKIIPRPFAVEEIFDEETLKLVND